jgi:predicted RNA-binding Zn-ribbon protein involved in translation (DUF1610 family)
MLTLFFLLADRGVMDTEGSWRNELMSNTSALQFIIPSNDNGNTSNFHCSHCGKIYLHKKTLRRHMLYDCGTRPRFSCSMCGLRVRRRYTLTRHLVAVHCVQRHEAECSVPTVFRRKRNLTHRLWSLSYVTRFVFSVTVSYLLFMNK